MTATDTTNETFVQQYIEAWSVEDHSERSQKVAKLYAEDARFYAAEPGDEPVAIQGLADITANITQVNERLSQGAGLTTYSTGFATNHDSVRVTWEMKTAEGNTAMNGANMLIRDTDGKIAQDYIFIG